MENEFKGTKGNWKVGRKSTKNNDGRFQCYVDNGRIINSPVCTIFGKTPEECDATAQLISKAPEMLEMLIHINDMIIDNGIDRIKQLEDFYKNEIERLIKEATTI